MRNYDELFDEKDHYGRPFPLAPADATERAVKMAEGETGFDLPPSYLKFLKDRNGGLVRRELDSWVNTVYGVSEDEGCEWGLISLWRLLVDEWEYPSDVGFPFADTQSGAHDAYFFDYGRLDENGEPAVIRIDNELDNRKYLVARNFEEFLDLLTVDRDMQGKRVK